MRKSDLQRWPDKKGKAESHACKVPSSTQVKMAISNCQGIEWECQPANLLPGIISLFTLPCIITYKAYSFIRYVPCHGTGRRVDAKINISAFPKLCHWPMIKPCTLEHLDEINWWCLKLSWYLLKLDYARTSALRFTLNSLILEG